MFCNCYLVRDLRPYCEVEGGAKLALYDEIPAPESSSNRGPRRLPGVTSVGRTQRCYFSATMLQDLCDEKSTLVKVMASEIL